MKSLVVLTLLLFTSKIFAKPIIETQDKGFVEHQQRDISSGKISALFMSHYKIGLQQKLLSAKQQHLDIHVSIVRPSYDPLTRGTFESLNNPIFNETNAQLRFSIRKSF